jgi:hypothetical protein
MSRDNIVIIHFFPIELYPPIQNILRVMEDLKSTIKITIITCSQKKVSNFNVNSSNRIQIIRRDVDSKKRIIRLLNYLNFYFFSLLKLLQLRPSKVLYFETISSFPALFYKILFPKTRLFVHYHEYTSINEFSDGMKIVKLAHKLEYNLISKFYWISHTNNKRINLFKSDYPKVNSDILYCLPNYPTVLWNKGIIESKDKLKRFDNRLKLVYIGALSFVDTYIKEIIDFVDKQSSYYDLEIYSFHIEDDLKEYIRSKNRTYIKYNGHIEYKDIPTLLKSKDIGLILYKGNTLNFIHNAPNKLFEYLVCGLDVWFPKEMEGCKEYSTNYNPKVIEIDFLNIENSLRNYIFSDQNRSSFLSKYTAEEVVGELFEKLFID